MCILFFVCFYKSGPHFDEVDESFLSLSFLFFFFQYLACVRIWARDVRGDNRQIVMQTDKPKTQRQTECVKKASYGVETLWETKAQGQ